jgi:beta-galactosidase
VAITHYIIDPHKPRNTFSLNGIWDVIGGEKSLPPQRFSSTVNVPSVVDMADPSYDWETFDFHWYRTSFIVEKLSHINFVFLKIEQSMFGTEVWLNGHHLGGSISCYTSHEYLLNEFLNHDGKNELIIRIGAKSTLPPESAVGRDQEKEIYTPGIWGDVNLICVGGARVQLVQVIPHIETSIAEVRVWIQNLEFTKESLLISSRVLEKKSDKVVSPIIDSMVMIDEHATTQVTFQVPIESMKLWSHEHPFLYEVELTIQEGKNVLDDMRTTFGMREFKIIGSDFYMNGKKILLRGGNIAFHRFLSDKQRKLLPWKEEWIKKALIDIPKEHHFNFFRNHLGQMYNRWYDIADEHGMLIQNEWQFWCATGSHVQIRKEFTEWLHDNWNHPCIIIWDPLNESSDDTVQNEIVPEMKKLDPTRPWESVDFLEEHPYIYSLGMVMNNRKFGFTRSLVEIESLPVPSMVNEFLWWWFNDKWEPTVLTKMIVERWMGKEYTKDDVIAHQSFLAQELIELFRRMRIKAIQPFVYISNNDGPTAHWFLNDIKDLQPKPLLKAIKNAFSPFGVSIELWDRHFFVNEKRSVRIFIFNDSNETRRGNLVVGFKSVDGEWLSNDEFSVEVQPMNDIVVTKGMQLPNTIGQYNFTAELHEFSSILSVSSKIAHVFQKPNAPNLDGKIVLLDPSKEIEKYLSENAIPFSNFQDGNFENNSVLISHGNVLGNQSFVQHKERITEFVKNGGRMVLIEPEYRVVGSITHTIVDGIDLKISQRADVEKGGYDSYVFAEDQIHPLWNNIHKEHLKFFNGSYGGEIVSQYDVDFSVPSKRLASCGLDLNVVAASEIDYGNGIIILVRLQLRGRLIQTPMSDSLYARRVDPVAQQLLLNIFEYSF